MRASKYPQRNYRVTHEKDNRSNYRLLALLGGGLLLTGGFLYATTHQLAAVNYGYQGEEMRRQQEQIRMDQAELYRQIDSATAPTKLAKAARQLGLQTPRPTQIGLAAQSVTHLSTAPKSGSRSVRKK